MGEAIEIYNDLKQMKAEKRASNRAASANMLEQVGIRFDRKNSGAHLIVYANGSVVDFWPGTGLWIVRGTSDQRRGVRKLIQFVRAAAAIGEKMP